MNRFWQNMIKNCSISPIIYLILLFGFIRIYNFYLNNKKIIPYNKWVLITGCDSGFGYLLTTKLLNEGYNVIATCLTDYGLNGIKNIADRMHTKKNNIVYVKCDVTKENEIKRSIEVIKKKYQKIDILINNAGKLHSEPLISITSKQKRHSLEN